MNQQEPLNLNESLIISRKAFLNKYDENYFTIGIVGNNNVIKLLNNLLSVVYNFCDWFSPKSLMDYWPESTTLEILDIVSGLKNNGILLTKEQYHKEKLEITPEKTKDESDYINDTVWYEAYLNAVKIIPEYSKVLNIGAKGAGAIPIALANQCTIEKIVATHTDLPAILMAKQKAEVLQLNNIDFIYAKPYNISPICFNSKFNVLLVDLFSSGVFEEKILESIIYAKNHFLYPNSLFIPASFDLKIFAFDSDFFKDMEQESKEFDLMYGLKFDSFRKALSKNIIGIYARINPQNISQISEAITVKNFDFSTIENANFEESIELKINQTSRLSGFCVYFDAFLTKDINLSNSPCSPKNRFLQRIFVPSMTINKNKDEIVKLKIIYDGSLKVYFV